MLSHIIRHNYRFVDHVTSNGASRLRSKIMASRLVAGSPKIKLSRERIIAVHVPKAGGSSLKHQFSEILKSRLALNYYYDDRKSQSPLEYPRGKAMIYGHFHPAVYGNTEAFRMTFLREPVDTILSIYAFWKTQPLNRFDDLHRKFLEEKPSILEFSSHPRISNLMSEVYFGGYDMRRFDFIGFHENRVADFERLSRLIGVQLSANVHCNPTRYDYQDNELRHNDKIKSQIASIARNDVAFYESVRAL